MNMKIWIVMKMKMLKISSEKVSFKQIVKKLLIIN